MRTPEPLSPYIEAFLRLIYPSSCGVCETTLELEEYGICQRCCLDVQKHRFDFEASCLDTSFKHVSEAWALYPYESPIKEILTAIKFSKKRWLIKTFASDLKTFGEALASENQYDAVIPIPLDRGRLFERHFNQAELFARQLSKTLRCPVQNLLQKKYRTPAQSRLTQKEREINLYQAFHVTSQQKVQGKRFLLVDDVLTTGATVREAARTLKEKGAKRVDVFTLACTLLQS